MKKIVVQIDTKGYYSDTIVKPGTPVFEFTNDGGLPIFINANFRILPQQKFGLNMQHLCARFLSKGYSIQCDSEFEISWNRPQTLAESGLSPVFYAVYLVAYYLNRRLCYQHTTFIIEK